MGARRQRVEAVPHLVLTAGWLFIRAPWNVRIPLRSRVAQEACSVNNTSKERSNDREKGLLSFFVAHPVMQFLLRGRE